MRKLLSIFIVFISLSHSDISLASERTPNNNDLDKLSSKLNDLLYEFSNTHEINTPEEQFAFLISILANINLYFGQAYEATRAALSNEDIFGEEPTNALAHIIHKIISLENFPDLANLQEIYNAAKNAGFQTSPRGDSQFNFDVGTVLWGAQAAAKRAIIAARSQGLPESEIAKTAYNAAKMHVLNYMMGILPVILNQSYLAALQQVPNNISLNFNSAFLYLEDSISTHLAVEERDFLHPWFVIFHEMCIFPEQATFLVFVMNQLQVPFDITRCFVLYFGLLAGRKHF